MPNPIDDLLNKPLDTGGIPVTHFKGTLKDVNLESREGRKSQSIVWDFTDLEVIATSSPYPFPTAKIYIPYTNWDKTPYAALKKSLDRVVGGLFSVDDFKGKSMEWCRLPAVISTSTQLPDGTWDNKNRKDELQEVWQVLGIEGYASPVALGDQMKELAKLANGKSEPEFYTAIMTDAKFKQDSGLVNSILDRGLVPAMIAAGVLERDGEGSLMAL